MYIGGQEHFYLETHCTIAVPKGEAGEMELFLATQNAMMAQVGVLGVGKGRGEREMWAGPGGDVRVVVLESGPVASKLVSPSLFGNLSHL